MLKAETGLFSFASFYFWLVYTSVFDLVIFLLSNTSGYVTCSVCFLFTCAHGKHTSSKSKCNNVDQCVCACARALVCVRISWGGGFIEGSTMGEQNEYFCYKIWTFLFF